MIHAQRDEEPAIQEFLRWTHRAKRIEEDEGRPFVPITSVKTYFDPRDRTRRLLRALFPDEDEAEMPHPDYVERHYILVFCILLCIGEGPLIKQFLEYNSLQDERLPFASTHPDFPVSSKSNLSDHFWQKQWEFCVPRFDFNMNRRFNQEEILPITRKQKLGMGGTAVLYKIKVEDGYDHLDPFQNQDEKTNAENGVYVLKSLRGKDAQEYFETERRAFLKLRVGNMLPPNIIGFYGSFVHKGRPNLILEYADKGSLEEFMHSENPPNNTMDFIDLWESLFGLLRGLTLFHGSEDNNIEESRGQLGWHQDIKPSNILVKSKNGGSSFQPKFLIADLGLSHFKRKNSTKLTDRDSFGTSAYGAPETFRFDNSMSGAHLQIRQDVDIWSLGCVFSEALTWSVFGFAKLLDYRFQRGDECHGSGGFDLGNTFHDGFQRLKTVSQFHRDIAKDRRFEVPLSARIIEFVDNDMLQEAGSRAPARFLYKTSLQLIETARREIQVSGSRDRRPSRLATSTASTLVDELSLPRSADEKISHNLAAVSNASDAPPSLPYLTKSLSLQSPTQDSHSLTTKSVSTVSNPEPYRSATEQLPLNSVTGSSSPTLRLTSPRAAPYLSLTDGLAWKSKSKMGLAKLPHEELLEVHRRRDHVFILDTSASMKEHTENLRTITELLAYILKMFDPDGITVYCTSETKKIVAKKSTAIAEFIKSAPTVEKSDMEQSLANMFSDYFLSWGMPKSSILGAFRRRSPKPLSVFIFTDGMWQPKNEPYDPIASSSRRLQSKNLPRSQVGIQFICFGNNTKGNRRLQELDSSLSIRPEPLDIVDIEPYDGNVLKMLLGAINHWFDEDAFE